MDAKITITTINDHLKSENTVNTMELVRKLKSNSLEPDLFERVHLIRLSHLKYSVTSFIDFQYIDSHSQVH